MAPAPIAPASVTPVPPAQSARLLPPLATEAEILARNPPGREAYRFALQPDIVVLQFATLQDQAGVLNRVAALVEKAGFPRNRVLDDAELDRRIRAGGDKPATFYYGHDYRVADLLGFFARSGQDGVPLTPDETWLHRSIEDWGWQPGTNGALISLVRADAGLDRAARATILRHELSHGVYFTNPAYAAFARQFWEAALTGAEQARFRTFLAGEGYDTGIEDLVINETQAYLMHTADDRYFGAAAIGMTGERLAVLRGLFLTGMPPGWLRDCTAAPVSALASPPSASPPSPVSFPR